jgi:CDP-4-dehydro-6-deoxyglucose reductase, E1
MNKKEQLKMEIFQKVKEYYSEIHKPVAEAPFIEGKSRINYAGRVFNEKEMTNLIDSGLDFWLSYGRYSQGFETKLADFLGVRWAVLVNSGSSANLLAFFTLTSPLLKEKRIKRYDEVITVAAGFPTTVSPIVQYGAIPVFVDVDMETFNIDTTQLENARSPKTKAIMIAHTLGNPFNLKIVKEFCDKYDIWLVEDNCDALGSKFNDKYTGTWGDIGTSSFYPAHQITMGEGGAVYTNNPLLKKIMISMRDWGRDCSCDSGVDNTCNARYSQQFGTLPWGYDHKYVYSHFGFNFKITDMQAAIGTAQLEKLPDFIEKRKENFSYLYHGLIDLDKYFIFPRALPRSDPCWFGFMLTLKDGLAFGRNDLTGYLEDHKIQTRNLFAGNIIRHPLFDTLVKDKDFRVINDCLPNTDKIMNDSFWIGVYPGMSHDRLEYMIKKIREFVKKYD